MKDRENFCMMCRDVKMGSNLSQLNSSWIWARL